MDNCQAETALRSSLRSPKCRNSEREEIFLLVSLYLQEAVTPSSREEYTLEIHFTPIAVTPGKTQEKILPLRPIAALSDKKRMLDFEAMFVGKLTPSFSSSKNAS